MKNELLVLFEKYFNEKVIECQPLNTAGSNRKYFRLKSQNHTSVGVIGTSVEENIAFERISNQLKINKINVPTFYLKSQNGFCYLQEDLGDVSLFDFIATGRKTGNFSETEKLMLQKAIAQLPYIQINGAKDFDFSFCYPQSQFDKRTVLWDLNYFKYCFLKLTKIDFLEDKLEDDFQKLSDILLINNKLLEDSLMYRDFQSRNVMIFNNEPYFIDFQGARKGTVFYDVASFLWQAKANFDDHLRNELLDVYLQNLSQLIDFNEFEFRNQLNLFVLFRILQVLGAYGFRGIIEKKTHFRQSIPFALENLRKILPEISTNDFSYLKNILIQLTNLEDFKQIIPHKNLIVKIMSFSYKKGIPEDKTVNGGGFVFDCRAVNNPGRHAQYAALTGLDAEVATYLENDGEILQFLQDAYNLADRAVARYLERGFTDLMVAFGCTGGQHRSVYSAENMAKHLNDKFGVEIFLEHRELNIKKLFLQKK